MRMTCPCSLSKIDVESRFTALLFDVCLFSGYYFVVMSDGMEPCEYCYSAMSAVYKMFTAVVLDVFKELYRDGYKTDDCENYIRNGFYSDGLFYSVRTGPPVQIGQRFHIAPC